MRFLLVDDHPMIREALQRTLAAEFPDAVFTLAATRTETLAAVEENFFPIVVLDLTLGGTDGLALIRDIKDRSPRSRILVHTMHPEDQLGVRALRLGAEGYLTKDKPVAQLLVAIHQLKAGHRYISPLLAERMADFLTRGGIAAVAEDLSDREFQVLRMVTGGKTPSEIAAELNLSIKTVSTYRTRLLEKLQLRTTADLIRFGLEHKLS